MIKFYLRLLLLLLLGTQSVWAQKVLDPNDPVINYDEAKPPVQPAWGSIGKWVRKPQMTWTTTSYKCYIYKGMQFRLKYPKNFNAADTSKKYPIIVFFHGVGEKGTIYDNEYQLLHGGKEHMNSVDAGIFDGFILYPQNQSGYWGPTTYDFVAELINNFFVPQLNVDPFRVLIGGLSGGGQAAWDFIFRYPKLTAAATPISAANSTYINYLQSYKFTPVWQFQGGVDPNPPPAAAQAIADAAAAAGANYKLSIYPRESHSVWDDAWKEKDYFPFMNRGHKANPWPLYGRTEFCPGDAIIDTLGLTAGFDGYEWRKDGVVIPGANSNTLVVNSLGTYDARVKSGNRWSVWSPIPVVIKIKPPTVTPDIQISGMMSNVLPTPEGKDSVVLKLPAGYTSYVWMQSGGTDTLGRSNTFTARTPGNYIAMVTEPYNCSSFFSNPFPVINAAGANVPDAAGGLIATAISKTQIKLNWTNNPSPAFNETQFEIYRAPAAGGPYTLAGKVNANVLTFTDAGLSVNTRYYYIVRAVNSNGAAPVSNEASAATQADSEPPSAPGDLKITATTPNAIYLSWTKSKDDVGVDMYDIYLNGKKTYTVASVGSTTTYSFTAYGLTHRQLYTIVVKARDASGNQSPASNQVSGIARANGLVYKYYNGAWSTLPNFNNYTPTKSGVTDSIDVSPRTQNDNYAFLWEGYINIPESGTYTFETYSDDGSKLYIDQPYDPTAIPLVNNDGTHTASSKSASIFLDAGPHQIALTYFERTGSGEIIQLYWKGPNIDRQRIPAAYFRDTIPMGAAPAIPGPLTITPVSYKKLNISWEDSLDNETGFEIYRNSSATGTYGVIATTGANVTSYTDSTLSATTNYYYMLKAINNYGSSAFTAYDSAKTLAVPSKPVAPSVLTATAVSGNRINLQWKDNSSDETAFDIYRSANTNANYVLIASLAANNTTQATFADTALFANARYYYKVTARNDGGGNTSNQVSATTLNNRPVMEALSDKSMRYGTQFICNISATDPDGETLTLTASNLPAFATLTDNGDGTAVLTFSPLSTDQSVWSNIQVKATDQHNGVATQSFTLTVNDNYLPALSTVADVTLTEKTTAQINLSAADNNTTDTTVWTLTGLPAFATFTAAGNTAQIQLVPGYADAGAYPVTVKVDDNRGGTDTKSFTIHVTDVNPNYSIYVDFTDGAYQGPATWNNTNEKPAQNEVYPDLKDNQGRSTGITLSVLSPWQVINGGANTNNQGVNTGLNSGVYPDNVMTSSWWTNTTKQTFRLTGLNPQYKYSFTFFGSRAGVSDSRIANYTINGASVTLNATNNATQTAVINDIRPDSAGGISVDLAAAAGSQYAYINAMVVNATFDDSIAPARPGHFAARNMAAGVRLSWTDQAYNETGYELYRSAAPDGAFTLLSPGPNANDTAYTDTTVISGQTWYYTARAVNGYGVSPYTDTVGITIPNKPPVLTAIADVIIPTDTIKQIAVTAADAAGDAITLSAASLPGFATFQDNGNGNGTITLSPTATDIGKYTLEIKAADSEGDTSSQRFTVQVTDKKVSSVYVNFNQVEPAGAPWNNFNALPNTNAGISNLQDETGTASGISITILDTFTGANNVGATTGDNSGVFPDGVMHTFFYDQSGTDRRVRISGLSAARKYNLVFFGSRAGVSDNRNTIYGADGQTVTLNAAGNTGNTVQLNGLSADSTGSIIFTVRQASGSFAAYINAMLIQSFVDDGTPLAPAGLTAAGQSRTSIQLAWSDKANNETGYEVWRSASRNGTYSLIATTGANVTTYKDSSLSANTIYYYKVRAVAATLMSAYSNIASGATLAYGIYVNYTITNIAGAPWNNTAVPPAAGYVWKNLWDDASNSTGISMTLVDNFTGTNPAGAQTGNNSGVYPDKALAESYYIEPGDTALLKFSGLDQAKQYSFTFLGSRAGGGTRVAAYGIGNKVVTLDANDNTQNTVSIDKVMPDKNGEIYITVYTAVNYGYLNALVMKAYPLEDSSSLQTLPVHNVGTSARSSNRTVGLMGAMSSTQPVIANTNGNDIAIGNVYPNPFDNFLNLNLNIRQQQATRVMVRLLDGNGRVVLMKDLGNRGSGVYQERLELGGKPLMNGLYLLQILFDHKPVKTIKLIKQ
jgi:pimeloyl-ACP methyl ester carboxylesterase